MKGWKIISVLLLVAMISVGCGNSITVTDVKNVSTDPVTLTLYQYANLSDDEINKFVIGPVTQKYPYITIKVIRSDKDTKPENLIASGTVPDLIFTPTNEITTWKNLAIPEDLTGLIKKYDVDLARIDPSILEMVRAFGLEKDKIYGLPFLQNTGVMLYNKDIFDKFGVPYPQNGMTWDDVLALARKITRTVDGTPFIGVDLDTITRMGMQERLAMVDPNTNKATINNDGWKKVLSLYQQLFQIPGFLGEKNKSSYDIYNSFFKDKAVGMGVTWLNGVVSKVKPADAGNMNWDIVSLPNFKGDVGKGREADSQMFMLSKQGKHKDQAFQVLSVVISDEVQTDSNKNGKITILNNSKIKDLYGADLPLFKGKTVANIFKAKPQPPHTPITVYDAAVRKVIDASAVDLAAGKDINTVLREAEEKANKGIEEAREGKSG